MTIQDRIQQALGRLIFENLLLQQQLEDAQAEVARVTRPVRDPEPAAHGIPGADRL